MRKVTVKATFRIEFVLNEGTEVSEVMDELNFDFTEGTGKADIVSDGMFDYEITDSR